MQHIENIKKLFTKSFVENPLVESFETGIINITSGEIVACDPLTTTGIPPFSTKFPIGKFQTLIHKERESNCVAYAEIKFSDIEPEKWEMAVIQGQNIKDLKKEEIFGYPVESGMGCFMDADAQNRLNDLEQLLFERKGGDFMGIYEEFFHQHFFDENGAIDQYAILFPDSEKEENILAFETGYGEGFYASYIGFDKNNTPVKLITEFIEIQS